MCHSTSANTSRGRRCKSCPAGTPAPSATAGKARAGAAVSVGCCVEGAFGPPFATNLGLSGDELSCEMEMTHFGAKWTKTHRKRTTQPPSVVVIAETTLYGFFASSSCHASFAPKISLSRDCAFFKMKSRVVQIVVCGRPFCRVLDVCPSLISRKHHFLG